VGRSVQDLRDVVDWGLCAGCGACAYALGNQRVTLVNIEDVGIRPRFDSADAESLRKGLAYCPGYAVDGALASGPLPLKSEADRAFGPALEIWEGHAADPEIRFQASSGGLLTALSLYCLENEGMGFVLHSGMDEDHPLRNRTVKSSSRAELLSRAGSRYAPASPCDGLQSIQDSDRPAVFIGKPCDAAGAMLSRKQNANLDRNLGLVLTFFCAGTPSTKGTLSLLNSLEINPAEVQSLRYRGQGWPGRFKARVDGKEAPNSLSYNDSWGRLSHYRSMRCHICPDGLGRVADLACGDAWDKFEDGKDNGRSIVLVRTERGREILHRAIAKGYVQLKPIDASAVLAAQKNLLERRKEIFGRLLARRLFLVPSPKFSGFSLFHSWLRLPFAQKLRTIGGSLVRLFQRGLFRRKRLFGAASRGLQSLREDVG
jgi:coenzyme F420 hydrogenase subunit beta